MTDKQAQGLGKAKNQRKRNTFDQKEKEIFLNIMKQSHGGKFWKTITEGVPNKQKSHDVWLEVTLIFNDATGKELDYKQIKAMWNRLKDGAKKKHDSAAVNREFNRACALTGGGAAPVLPPEEDGDDLDLNLHDLDPTETNYNELAMPGERHSFLSGLQSRGAPLPSPRQLTSGPAFLFPGHSNPIRFPTPVRSGNSSPHVSFPATPTSSNRSSPLFPNNGPLRLTPPSGIMSETPGIRPIVVATGQSEFSSVSREILSAPFSANPLPEGQVLIVDERGSQFTVNVDEETPRVTRKKTQKRSMNEDAGTYYFEMLDIQKRLAEKKMTVLKRKEMLLKRKEENEIIKGKILQRTLLKEGGVIPDTMEESEEEDNSEGSVDSSEDRNVVLFISDADER